MGLVKCQDCGKMISDLSEQCFNCGRPLKAKEDGYVSLLENEPRKPLVFGLLGVTLFALIWSFFSGPEIASSAPTTRVSKQQTDNNEVTGSIRTTPIKWYEGGNLHQKTIQDWVQATRENRLATCADFAASHPNIKKIMEKSDSMEALLPYAIQLVAGIDEYAKDNRFGNHKVSETAAALMLLLKW
ncbi:hypothetical protein MASR1M12_19080 [Erysipelotrichia bacterium]